VGKDKLNTMLIGGLQDGSCLYECVEGLSRYGNESAIKPLRVIERFYTSRGKGDLRYSAAQAIRSILQRAGKPTEEVSRDHYSDKELSYNELIHTAAHCPNAAIRSGAISLLERCRNDHTALFFIERLRREQNHSFRLRLARALGILTLPAADNSKSVVSPPVVREAFAALVLMAETDSPRMFEQEGSPVSAARTVLHAARRRQIHLDHIDRYKKIIRQGLSANIEYPGADYYSGCTAIAMLLPDTGKCWLPTERKQIQQQLSPLLDSPDPNIRLIECLGHIGDKRLTPRLIELLGHEDASIREFAAHALGRIGDSRALSSLEHLARTDPYQYANGVYGVREAARKAIERIRLAKPSSLTNLTETHKVD
jgi:HEAT repeat protein